MYVHVEMLCVHMYNVRALYVHVALMSIHMYMYSSSQHIHVMSKLEWLQEVGQGCELGQREQAHHLVYWSRN